MRRINQSESPNTLFNYFTKTPPNKKTKLKSTERDPQPSCSDVQFPKPENKKRDRGETSLLNVSQIENSSDEEDIPLRVKKRIKPNPLDSDESDEENQVDNKIQTPKENAGFKKTLLENFKFTANQSPKGSKSATSSSDRKGKTFDTVAEKTANDIDDWMHSKLEWLKPDKIRDAQKRKPDHPDYDPTTLYVPPEFFKTLTPAHHQWWKIKSARFDCVLIFKVGKFYELFHMDAAVGVKELQFTYMKGEYAHSGFPESAYGKVIPILVSKGYKVARVEQTETPEIMQERCKATGKNSKLDKVMLREVCQVTQLGTQVCGLQDPGPAEPTATYMFAICEQSTQRTSSQGCSTYGVCFMDTSIGLIHLGQFEDDKHSSRLLTVLAHYPPALVIHDRTSVTPRTSKLLSTHCHSARRETRSMWSAETTLKTLSDKYYNENWPEGLKPFLHKGDLLGLTPAADCSLAIKALGGCVAHLTDSVLDIQILGMARFTVYEPLDIMNNTLTPEEKVENQYEGPSTMVLDAITLKNLRIVQNEGCLYQKLNFCSTPMGKRMLHHWVCAPSCNLTVIKHRQQVVEQLFNDNELRQKAKDILTKLPDLERLLAKVHTLGSAQMSKHHPDSRAIFYEAKTQSKRKVLDFIIVLNGFTTALQLVDTFEHILRLNPGVILLKKIAQFEPNGSFPDYRETLKFFKEKFDLKRAQTEGRIVPEEGVDCDYDDALQTIAEIERDLRDYLADQEQRFKSRLTYVGTDKKRFQIEIRESAASQVGLEYKLEGTRKGFKRFSTEETRSFLARMIAAEEVKSNLLKDLSRRMFEMFSAHNAQWEAAVRCIATLDVLLALAEFARQQPGEVCLPNVTYDNKTKPFINIVEGRHPCIPIVNDFIPNDTALGTDDKCLLLLTGPNMGGKSTLMRQVGLLSVLAHMGSYVPALECNLSLMDRIFTRLGASDDILSGQSTFLVEMKETAAIVAHATVHSLVLLDELGRGTSTYDGTAIASGVCAALAERGCRTLFSTHYHSLVDHFAQHPKVQQGHMACMVETAESVPDSEDHIPEETITFLYKLTPGSCPKSYGFNAARLAGIPSHIIRKARQESQNLDREGQRMRALREFMKNDYNPDMGELLLRQLNI